MCVDIRAVISVRVEGGRWREKGRKKVIKVEGERTTNEGDVFVLTFVL